MDEQVECHSGYRYAEKPRAFIWQGERLLVEQILQAWRSPSGPRFKILTRGQQVFELAYDEHTGRWDIQPG